MTDALIQKIREAFNAKGPHGTFHLNKFFRKHDDIVKDGMMDLDEFKDALKGIGVNFTHEECEQVYYEFDSDKSGSMSVDEFMAKMRDPLTGDCLRITEKAFSKFDKTGDGIVTADDLKQGDDDKTSFDDYLSSFDKSDPTKGPVEVTKKEFLEHYATVRAGVLSDERFINIIKKEWKVTLE